MFNNSQFNIQGFNQSALDTITVIMKATSSFTLNYRRIRTVSASFIAQTNTSIKVIKYTYSNISYISNSNCQFNGHIGKTTPIKSTIIKGTMNVIVQPTLLEAILSLNRHITAQVEIYFYGLDKPPVVVENADIDSLELLEEIKTSTKELLGYVSANELHIRIANKNRRFSSSNTSSPYHGYLKPKIPIKAYIHLHTTEDFYYPINLGTFFTDDWADNTDELVIPLTTYDRLYFILSDEFSGIRMQEDISFYDLFKLFFDTIGLSEQDDYTIDTELRNSNIKKAWLPAGTVGSALNTLALASQSYVFTDRNNKITVRSILTQKPLKGILHDRNLIEKMKIPTSYSGVYSKLITNVYVPQKEEEVQLLSVEVEVPPGENILPPYRISRPPLHLINRLEVQAKQTLLTEYEFTTDEITFTLNNTSEETEKVRLIIYGNPISFNAQKITNINEELVDIIGEHTLTWDHQLIQDVNYANKVKDVIFPLVSNINNNTIIEYRGNPLLQAGNSIIAYSDIDKIPQTNIFAYRTILTFAGGLHGTIYGYTLN